MNIEDFQKNHSDKKVVFTNGCFDILHVGHIRYLADAKKLGDVLVVGLNSDASVKRLKGPTRPIQNEDDRKELLMALEAVDQVFIFDEDTPLNLIKKINPQFLVKGGDWAPDQIVGSEYVLSLGGQVKSLPFSTGKSTTDIVGKIEAQIQSQNLSDN